VGERLLELIFFREKGSKRETKLLNMLLFVNTNIWRAIFGKSADSLEKSTENEDECMSSFLERENV
jgi:hypothetical protein